MNGSNVYIGHTVLAGDVDSDIILHVPHSSRVIPPKVRAAIILSDDDVRRELDLMTDAHTDGIAAQAASAAGTRPWTFLNQLSRLVIDPERLPNAREPMNAVGMGAVYQRTASGSPLRRADTTAEYALLETWFHPYATAMTDLVDERLAACGRATIIDVHSYPSRRLPYESGGERRPEICLGTDQHTPDWLLAAARRAFADLGDVEENTPFAGCYVPLKHLGTDLRVAAIMVEIRRDIYMVEPGGEPTRGLDAVSQCLAFLIDASEAP